MDTKNVMEAVKIVKGYCAKHNDCDSDGCVFYDFPEDKCKLKITPQDWKIEEVKPCKKCKHYTYEPQSGWYLCNLNRNHNGLVGQDDTCGRWESE